MRTIYSELRDRWDYLLEFRAVIPGPIPRCAAARFRASGYYTAEDLDALFDDYHALLAKHGHTARDAPPGARLMQLRMFYIPDEPAEQEP